MSSVKTLHKNNWQEALHKANRENRLVVMEFMASWSEPSKLMNPIVANIIAPEFRDCMVDFCMLDIDEFKDLACSLRVEALPTFLLVRNYKVKKRIVGVDKDELRCSIMEFMVPSSFY